MGESTMPSDESVKVCIRIPAEAIDMESTDRKIQWVLLKGNIMRKDLTPYSVVYDKEGGWIVWYLQGPLKRILKVYKRLVAMQYVIREKVVRNRQIQRIAGDKKDNMMLLAKRDIEYTIL